MLVSDAHPAAGSLKGIEMLPTEVASLTDHSSRVEADFSAFLQSFPIGPDIYFLFLVVSASGLTSQALWESRGPPKNTSSSLSPSFSSAPLVWAYRLPQLVPRQLCTLSCFSSHFHENLVVTHHTSAGVFPPQKKARAPAQETSTETCPDWCGAVLFACCSACGFACRSGCSCFRSLVFLCFSLDTSRECFLQLVSKVKPTENSPQISNLLWLPARVWVLTESVADVSSCA